MKDFFEITVISILILWLFFYLPKYLIEKSTIPEKKENITNNIEKLEIINNFDENIFKCFFKWEYYDLPKNAHCKTLSKINAWECNDWYIESWSFCIEWINQNKCNIKWNISFNSKTKVYYLPYCLRYNDVEINTNYWEKWFCSEQEAINYWWIKADSCY